MRTQLFNQRAFAFLMPSVTLAMNALSLTIYWVGASIVNNVPAADTALRLAAFSDIVVFGTYATYVIMSLMMIVMIIMIIPAAQVSAQRINEVLEARNSLTQGARTDPPEVGHRGVPGRLLPLSLLGQELSWNTSPSRAKRGDRGLHRRNRQRQDHSGQPGRPVL